MTATAPDIAAFLDREWAGPRTRVDGVAALDSAGPDDLAFCVYDDPAVVEASDAGVIVCPPSISPMADRALVFDPNPRAGFARAAAEFLVDECDPRIHPTAVVESGATLGDGCRIGPGAYVADCVTLGERCTVRANAALGCHGFGFPRGEDGTPHRLPHTGDVVLGDGVEVGANSTIDRAVFGETAVRNRAKISANVHLAHGVTVGEGAYVTYGCGLAGNATVGPGATLNPHVAVATDVSVGDGAEVGTNAAVLDDVPPNTTVVGTPARPIRADEDEDTST